MAPTARSTRTPRANQVANQSSIQSALNRQPIQVEVVETVPLERVDAPHAGGTPVNVDTVIGSPESFFTDALPAIDYSLTIVARGNHVKPVWLDSLNDMMVEKSTRSSMSLERGGKQENLHIQAVVTLRFPKDKMLKLKEIIKGALGVRRADGSKWCVP